MEPLLKCVVRCANKIFKGSSGVDGIGGNGGRCLKWGDVVGVIKDPIN